MSLSFAATNFVTMKLFFRSLTTTIVYHYNYIIIYWLIQRPQLTHVLNLHVVKVIFLMTKAGVTEESIGKVVALGPELLGCSIVHKLEVNVKYYLSLGIRLRQLGEMVADFQMLLRYNIDVLRPKYSYLRKTMVRTLQDLIEFPRYHSDIFTIDAQLVQTLFNF